MITSGTVLINSDKKDPKCKECDKYGWVHFKWLHNALGWLSDAYVCKCVTSKRTAAQKAEAVAVASEMRVRWG